MKYTVEVKIAIAMLIASTKKAFHVYKREETLDAYMNTNKPLPFCRLNISLFDAEIAVIEDEFDSKYTDRIKHSFHINALTTPKTKVAAKSHLFKRLLHCWDQTRFLRDGFVAREEDRYVKWDWTKQVVSLIYVLHVSKQGKS